MMLLKAYCRYRHKSTGRIIIPIGTRTVTPEIALQYEEVEQVAVEPRPKDQSYDVKRMIEKNTGVSE
jgi:hypothetical protein